MPLFVPLFVPLHNTQDFRGVLKLSRLMATENE